MKFEGLFYICIVEYDMVYVKILTFKKHPMTAPCGFWGVPNPLNRNAPGGLLQKILQQMHDI